MPCTPMIFSFGWLFGLEGLDVAGLNLSKRGEVLYHRLNMELDLQSLFGLHVYTVQLYSLSETPHPPPPYFGTYTRALLVIQDRRHLFVTPCVLLIKRSVHLNYYCTCCLYGAGRMDLDGGKSITKDA
jgi:hypothetical protein